MKKLTKAQANWLALGKIHWSIGRMKAMQNNLYQMERDFPELKLGHLRSTLEEVLTEAKRLAEKRKQPEE